MSAPTTGTVVVPGANLYREIRGSGPVLLLIPGGNGDAGPYQQIAADLADRYTVVSYDRRGFSRSPLTGPVDQQQLLVGDPRRRLAADVEDAVHLLDLHGDGPGYVLGSSSGAIVALELLTRHPDRIGLLIAHEPPLITLLPDAQRYRTLFDEVYLTARRDGTEAAMRRFSAAVGLPAPQRPPQGVELPPHAVAAIARIRHNLDFWLEYELRQYPEVVPDLQALRVTADRLILAGGSDSHEQVPYRPNTVLAELLGRTVVDLPGGHIGYVTHPAEFAARLGELLTSAVGATG